MTWNTLSQSSKQQKPSFNRISHISISVRFSIQWLFSIVFCYFRVGFSKHMFYRCYLWEKCAFHLYVSAVHSTQLNCFVLKGDLNEKHLVLLQSNKDSGVLSTFLFVLFCRSACVNCLRRLVTCIFIWKKSVNNACYVQSTKNIT